MINRKIIALTGITASKLINGLTTQCFKDGVTKAACFLNGKGKITYTGIITPRSEQQYWIDVESSKASELQKVLKKYSFGQKVEIHVMDDIAVCEDDSISGELLLRVKDPRHGAFSDRIYKKVDKENMEGSSRRQVRMGIASEEALIGQNPLFFNLDFYNYLHFSKGCYIGQQVISRAHFTGLVRKRAFVLRKARDTPNPQPNDKLQSNSSKIGTVVQTNDTGVIAALRYLDIKGFMDLSAVIKDQKQNEYQVVDELGLFEFLREELKRIEGRQSKLGFLQ